VLGFGVNTLLAMALLTAPPRLHLPPRRVIGPALVITIGLEILKTLGQIRRDLEVCCPLDGGRRSRRALHRSARRGVSCDQLRRWALLRTPISVSGRVALTDSVRLPGFGQDTPAIPERRRSCPPRP
ncbi:hypothetical protein AB0I79_31325, partial [Nonomuraea sp. NPDC050202]